MYSTRVFLEANLGVRVEKHAEWPEQIRRFRGNAV
jgi:hypothetical protein